MTPERRALARRIFLEVCDLGPSERAARVAALCGDDGELHAQVEALLREDPGEHDTAFAPLVTSERADDVAAALLEAPGTMIGPYRIVQVLGEGGFGTVFLAQQESPINRRVALKVIKLGMDTRQVVARFEQERQALAMMDHPNIAKVFDAGATSNGRPYFVMEYCKGQSITHHCDEQRLSVTERLGLFVQVCQAVQHAHQKGLIHRDLKPGNILVADVDGRPVAKVIDFGIAKATQADAVQHSQFTRHGQLIGTPEYMSPEQAEGGLDIDTRTDIYALGVLLYELLTGSTPFDARSLRSAAFDEIRRIIREVDPPRPSTRLSQSTATLSAIASNRRSEPTRLGGLLRGELDWVVMKAIEKQKDRRYTSASEFADDISRYLRDEPVSARPTTATYRWQKFARRNKGLVVAVGAVTVALAAGLAATTLMYLRAEQAREREAAQRERAETKTATTQAINDFLTQDLLAASNPWDGGGRSVTVAQTLDKAGAQVQSRFVGMPQVEASIRTTLAESYRSLGLFSDATPHYQRAIDLRSATDSDEIDLANLLRMQAGNLQSLGQYAEAEKLCRDALARHTRLNGAESPEVADALECLADIQIGQSLYAEAEKSLRSALSIRQSVAKSSANDLALARLTNTLSSNLSLLGNYTEAEKLKLTSLDLFKAATGEKSAYVAQVLSDLGALYFEMEKYPESERYFNLSLPLMTELLGADHLTVLVNRRSLANTISFLGRDAEAEPMFREVIAASERTIGAAHPQTMAAVNSLATMFLRSDRDAEAEPLLQSLLDRSSKEFGATHAETLKYAVNLAWCERHLKKLSSAETHFRRAVEGFESTLGRLHPYTLASYDGLAQLLAADKRWQEAAANDKVVIERRAEAGEAEDADTARILGRMGNNLLKAREFVAAREPLARSLDLVRKLITPPDWRVGTAEMRLGHCLSNVGEAGPGETLLIAGIAKMRADSNSAPGNLSDGLQKLAEHYRRNGQSDKAAEIEKELPQDATAPK